MNHWLEKGSYFLLLLLLLLLSIYFYSDTITLLPSYIHAWTQSDRLALALGFVDNGLNFFKPQTFNLATIEGVTGVDFPINEYLVAILFKITGSEHPVIFRLYILSYAISGYFFLFRLGKLFTHSMLKSFVLVIFAFSCPVITYYQAGFLPSTTALASAFIGYYFYFYYLKNRKQIADCRLQIVDKVSSPTLFSHLIAKAQQLPKQHPFVLAIGFLTLAALMRTPFNIFLFATLLHQMVLWVYHRKINWKELGIYGVAYAVVIGYQGYKMHLNYTYGTQFLTFLLPAENWADFKYIVQTVYEVWRFQLFSTYHYLLLFISSISLLVYYIRYQKIKDLLAHGLLQTSLIIAGACCYFLLMAQQFLHHEYYFIDSFYLGWFLILLLGLTTISIKKHLQQLVWGMVFGLLLLGGIRASKAVQEVKYAETTWDRCELTRKNFMGADQYLADLGIPTDAKILVIDAYSTNLPLILMDRKGYTVLHTKRENIVEALTWDFDYIAIQDVFLPSEVYINYSELPRQLQRIGGNGRISIFKMAAEPSLAAGNLPTLLGIHPPFHTALHRFDHQQESDWSNFSEITSNHYYSSPSSGLITEEMEFGPAITLDLADTTVNKVLFEGYFLAQQNSSFKLAISLAHQQQQIFYQDYALTLPAEEQWQERAYVFVLPKSITPKTTLKCYLWNPDKNKVHVDDFRVTLY